MFGNNSGVMFKRNIADARMHGCTDDFFLLAYYDVNEVVVTRILFVRWNYWHAHDQAKRP